MTIRYIKKKMAYNMRDLKIKRVDPNHTTPREKEDSDVDGFQTLRERNRYMRTNQEFDE
jgi:hypothetical protein